MQAQGKVKIRSEAEVRRHILEYARMLKCEGDVLQIFQKYDGLLANCTNQQEREAIGRMGVMEIHNFIKGEEFKITINGKPAN